MDTATALVISLLVISILTILILIIVNVRIFLIRKKYSTKKEDIDLDSKNLKENKKDNLNIEKNSIININKNINNKFILKEEKDYYDYFNLLPLNDLKKALINLEINFDEKKSKEELIFLLLEKLQDAENEKRK